jgi:hypothetical protein
MPELFCLLELELNFIYIVTHFVKNSLSEWVCVPKKL